MKNQLFRRIISLVTAATVCLAALSGCSGTPEDPSGSRDRQTAETPERTEAPASVKDPNEGIWAENMNSVTVKEIRPDMEQDDFDLRFVKYISENTDGNYMVSPLSFRYALGLLLAGASGETKEELLKALGVSSEEEWIRRCLVFNGFTDFFKASLERDIEQYKDWKQKQWIDPESPEPFRALRVANSVWKRANITEDFKEGYKSSVSGNYAAEYRIFTPQNAVEKINEWASVKTEKMIEKLLPENYPTQNLAVVLMNALYFKDTWTSKFYEGATKEDVFHAKSGKTVRKEFMHQEEHFPYYEDAETKLVILPMEGGVYMAFVLGSQEKLPEKISSAEWKNVRVSIPKMDLESSFDHGELVSFLYDSGVRLAFDADCAAFSEMIDHDIYVDDIIQKTRIKLDEDGVEAAAVTAIMTRDTAFLPEEAKVFTADQPFSFYIYCTAEDTTSILFAGEIAE